MKTLAEIFKNRHTTDTTANGYYWFLDETNTPIGITQEITATERDLIEQKYISIDAGKTLWHSFLLNKNSASIPAFSDTTTINFIFFSHSMDIELQQEFLELVQGFSADYQPLFLEQNYGVILDFSATTVNPNEVNDFLLAAGQDFSSELTFYQTMYYKLDRRLPEKFAAEFELFKKFRSDRSSLMRNKDIFLNYFISSEIISVYPIFGDWFQPLLTLDAELLAVVKCYLENGFNVTNGAKIMHMHRNTFMNKLDRFIELTGLDVKNFDEAAIAYLLIKLRHDV